MAGRTVEMLPHFYYLAPGLEPGDAPYLGPGGRVGAQHTNKEYI